MDNHVIPDKDPMSALGLGPGNGARAPAYNAHLPTEPLLPSETWLDLMGGVPMQHSLQLWDTPDTSHVSKRQRRLLVRGKHPGRFHRAGKLQASWE